MRALRNDPAQFSDLLRGCQGSLNVLPTPAAKLSAADRYGAAGTSEAPQADAALASDAVRAYRQALCYALSGDLKYAASSQRILGAWAGTLRSVESLQSQGNINFYLPYMVVAAGWVKDAGGWNHAPFGQFLRRTILPLAQLNSPDNHGLWAIFMQASIGAYLGDAKLVTAAKGNWQKQLRGMVQPDGTMPLEMARSDTSNYTGGPTKGDRGLAYTNYALLPAALTAQVLEVAGQPVWNTPGGELLRRAFAKAAGWVLRPKTFPYYASNGGHLQDTDVVGYFALLLRHYPNPDAEAVLERGQVKSDGFALLKLFSPRGR